ncbi:dehydrogenase [Candidatus Bathyarchaeota archaeon]|nr:MAG: dehydrogenase [Candidatus Bathyarchaeota archaeon]
MRLKDKVAIITGAGQGIGREYALGFAREGAKVAIAEIKEENAVQVAREIEALGGTALAVPTDVSDEKSTQAMAARVAKEFGRIDVLVNNAAIYYGLAFKPSDEISVEEWDRVFAVNVRGVWLCIKAVLPYMKKQGRGKIINISSGTWLMGVPYLLHYATTKAAVVGLTRCLARELGQFGININAISPGYTMSEASKTLGNMPPGLAQQISQQTALGRNEEPRDLVGTCIFLASEDSDFITGQLINVDGGWAMH